jgi:hypothetical protein
MHALKSFSAPVRKAIHLVLWGTVIGLVVAVAMVARPTSEASGTGLHSAAPKVVAPHKAAKSLLPAVDQEDIIPRQRIIADNVLRSLPSYCRDYLDNFYVNYDKNAANRGLGGEDTIIVIGNVPDREFRALIVHECGHVTDLGGLRGTTNSGKTSFYDGNTPMYANDPSVAFYSISWITPQISQPGTQEEDFVSGYASSDPFEDFAETFAYYALQKEAFQKLAAKNKVLKAKYDFMEQVVFAGSSSIAKGQYVPGKKVPWDVTKLPCANSR